MASQHGPTLQMAEMANRVAAAQAVIKAAQDNPNIWVLTADVASSVGLAPFGQMYPERFLNVGIAEQSLMGIAAGLATCGKIPFAATYAFLASMRACEQVRTDIAYPCLNVKIFATHAGVALGQGGTTHHATEDMAIMRSFANMTILVPADVLETRKAVEAAIAHQGPVYLRLGRNPSPIVYTGDLDFRLGKANLVRAGSDVTLIGCGRMVAECWVAAELLAAQGASARVLDMHTVKPIDVEAVEDAGAHTRLIVTVEDHNIIGGLGSAVAEVLAEAGLPTRLVRLGFRDTYAGIGPEPGLLEKHGLTGPKIFAEVMRLLQ
ncbi:MAG: transketolase family protein [Anaerolineae bacterium]